MPASSPVLTPVGRDPVARRVCDYLNRHFEGNMRVAARDLGVAYDPLRRTALGLATRGPSLDVIEALAKHSGQTLDWWLAGRTP